ncbi:hypothetical protein BDN72DRAFT_763219 [Pluteus cervinus]|uniref:Uncharacterized protein n=1 Tax=Pluteus cervinus TaxID=181527 RepID=A0ACD3B321_9AGAR|nr:hypothetical protein BDN72DRAFT_763219 [Pluteus cervinus]
MIPRTLDNHKRSDALVALADPATALQCLRNSWGPTTEDLLYNLINQGSSFFLLWREHLYSQPIPYPPPPVLGYRPPGFQPTTADYGVYEQRCHAALTPGVITAAIKKGGILWRLVQEHIQSNSEVVDDLLQPPSLDLSQIPVQFSAPEYNTRVDYLLDEETENLICGVYNVYTDDSKGTCFSEKSWWPKAITWEVKTSTLKVGYWAPDCEQWFNDRLQKIKRGEATLKSATEWRKSLKIQPVANQVVSHHKTLAQRFLNGEHFE